MKVLKFGGGCLKDVNSIRILPKILKFYEPFPCLIVLSAFGKSTNLLENLQFESLIKFYTSIMNNLKFDKFKVDQIIEKYFSKKNLNSLSSYSERVAVGELISSEIIFELLKIQHDCIILKASDCIFTEKWKDEYNYASFHSASLPLNWQSNFIKKKIIITQGFIASEFKKNITTKTKLTTLGREGSDYSAAIFGSIVNADEVILYKDVKGIFDKDPKKNIDAIFFENLTYDEAYNICNKNNTVVHPKTLKHLQKHKIKLRVKLFCQKDLPGTTVTL
tara:strand:- start:1928 stop:2758 length:831 start_codon:yes stop_codon:yes gene_type:complete